MESHHEASVVGIIGVTGHAEESQALLRENPALKLMLTHKNPEGR